MEGSPGVLDAIVQIILQNGMAGVGLIALAYVNRAQWLRNNTLTDQLIEMGQQSVKAQGETAASMNRLVDVIRVKVPE
ncbi:hypothetical protein LJR231_001557 [Phyllobacterium sp. LjRoot231]|uniref:hypothetical protein n=1 Tax=Phyllobacterium sp. LjRoot231 TaxID=3342289 RepID=UPI003ECE5267